MRMTTRLLLPDTLEELQHGKSRVRGAIVRPTCELKNNIVDILAVGDDDVTTIMHVMTT